MMSPALYGRPTAIVLKEHGVRLSACGRGDNSVLKAETPSLQSAFSVFHSVPMMNHAYVDASNIAFMKKFHEVENPEFTGGTKEEVYKAIGGDFNQEPFLKARQDIGDQMQEMAISKLFAARKRRRHFSEHDGELDFDRQWELRPFHSTKHDNSGFLKSIDVDVQMGFNCGVEAKAIAKYGAICWSVIDLLERSGISCNVKVVVDSAGSSYHWIDGNEKKPVFKTNTQEILVKRSDQYVDTMDIARCFTPWFFRSVMFVGQVMMDDACGLITNSGLGSSHPKDSSAEPGKIFLGANLINNEPDLVKLNAFIETAIRGEQGAAA